MPYPKGKPKSQESKDRASATMRRRWSNPEEREKRISLVMPKRTARENRECPICRLMFIALITKGTKYCSNKCRHIGKRKPMPKCIDCGNDVAARTARFRCRSCYNKWFHGENTWRWNGGVTPKYKSIRMSAAYNQWRTNVFTRDKFQCVLCGNSGKLHADHIKPFSEFPELRLNINNGRTLCIPCHAVIHSDRSYRHLIQLQIK